MKRVFPFDGFVSSGSDADGSSEVEGDNGGVVGGSDGEGVWV